MRNRPSKKEGNGNGLSKYALIGVVWGIPLFVKLGVTYLGFKLRAKKAGKIFKRQLIEEGMDPEMAKVLTEDYLSSSEVISMTMRNFRWPGPFGHEG